MMPRDPAILYSYVRTWLRDHEGGFEEFVRSHDLDPGEAREVREKLAEYGLWERSDI